ncbi:MAG: hypothetical protein GMKNLPBB_02109 [Myxococcota bacterium]|nr:hypothetical protein [Myxococcota bacterium]
MRIDLRNRTIECSVTALARYASAGSGGVRAGSWIARAQLGQEIHRRRQHQSIAAGAEYIPERHFAAELRVDDFRLRLEGRADGVSPARDLVLVDEIKSVDADAALLARARLEDYPRYLAQLRLYRLLAELEYGVPSHGRLVLISAATGEERCLDDVEDRPALDALVADLARRALLEAEYFEQRRSRLAEYAAALRFPFDDIRPGQRLLVDQVEETLCEGGRLLAGAPTGLGKTAAVLHPALRHALQHGAPLVYATSKNTQHEAALHCLRQIAGTTAAFPPFRAISLRAKERMCATGSLTCHEELCSHLRGCQNRITRFQLEERSLERMDLLPDNIFALGAAHEVCPFELQMTLTGHADVIICDYNYVFDPRVAMDFAWLRPGVRPVLIVDEIHNLADRARNSHSAVLETRDIRALEEDLTCGALHELLAARLGPAAQHCAMEWSALLRAIHDALNGCLHEASPAAPGVQRLEGGYPEGVFRQFAASAQMLNLRLALAGGGTLLAGEGSALSAFTRNLSLFAWLAELGTEGFEHYLTAEHGGAAARIVCLAPARVLARRYEDFQAVIGFSATLHPLDFHRRLLGLGDDCRLVQAPPAFPPGRRLIRIDAGVRTTFRERGAHAAAIAERIAAVAGARRGNYMALFPSHGFMRAVMEHFHADGVEVIMQEERASDARRSEIIQRMRAPGRGVLLACIQGGVFAEGLDFPGEELIGAIIVGPGLPAVSYERERMRFWYEDESGGGFEYAYLYPGLQRVIQSAGRVIRTATDTGVIVLLDERFTREPYASALPPDWAPEGVWRLVSRDLAADLRDFWSQWDQPEMKPG